MMWVLIVVALGVWIALAFAPSVQELYRRRDAAPLPVSDRYREDLRLGASDARPEVGIAPGKTLVGTVAADRTLRLGVGCSFERLHAPTVWFGAEVEQEALRPAPSLAFQPPPGTDLRAGRYLVQGDLTVPGDTQVDGDLVATGQVRLGTGVVVEGSIKSYGDLVVESGGTIRGNLFSRGDLRLASGCRVRGVVVAEGELSLAAGSVVGTPDALVTATGQRVSASAGACVHGTVWALGAGRVTADRGNGKVTGPHIVPGHPVRSEEKSETAVVPSGNSKR